MAKISLCLIVGNCEDYIARCLTSFAPIADEICVVRAVGSLVPDRTIDIAKNDFGARIGEYKNKAGHSDWPHIDDFGAARQQSFNMATGDYLFWCDADDVLERGADVVRELAERNGYACFVFPYKIFGRGLMVPRERMMARGSGKWRWAVHECFDFAVKPIHGIEDDRVIVTHMPPIGREGSNDRNLRIMQSIPESELTPGLLYHMHAELVGKNMVPEAIEAAKKALASPDLGPPERYEIFLNLARLSSQDLAVRGAYLTQAYAADPTRREALGLLACNAMDLGQNQAALAYARQMIATLRPVAEAWNSRGMAYEYVGDDIYMQTLRVNGMADQAEKLRRQKLKEVGGPLIALIHATRGRPQQASMARKLWSDFAEHPERLEHIFIFDEDDPDSQVLSRFHHVRMPPGGGCVAAWNMGAFATEAPVLIQMSDDWTPVAFWDRLILERIGDLNKPAVLAISDGVRRDQLLCMAICTRAYFCQDFYMFHPWFSGVYSDNWFTKTAYERGQVIEARDIVFSHNHPLATGKPLDKTYQEQNSQARYAEGAQVFEMLSRKVDWSSVHGWFNYWPFYQQIAQALKDGDTVAEVGVWFGRSIIYLAQELQRLGKRNVRLIAVDSFLGDMNQPEHVEIVKQFGGSIRAAFEDNIQRCNVAGMIRIIEGDSAASAAQVADESLAFCYVDAAHDYESVKKDLLAWRPKVKPGGIFAGHDAQWEPVMKAVREVLGEPATNGPCWIAQ